MEQPVRPKVKDFGFLHDIKGVQEVEGVGKLFKMDNK